MEALLAPFEFAFFRNGMVDALLMLVLALAIIVTMQVLSVTLVAATLVIPPTVARMLTHAFGVVSPSPAPAGLFVGTAVPRRLRGDRSWRCRS